MADEVPVCDVLCEAMEYLSKLGTNLRARSENLKEKRIRKDKLKNNHAVQKAADKVLLICELSKKSLENVECGVRKILTLLSASQGPRAPGRDVAGSSTNAHQDQDKYRYFKYRSYKLKVAKKVPVKHYMSVRVLARNMSLSMHDKYPVYHNCKLYRSRKRKEQARKSVENIKNCEEKKSNKVEPNKTDGVHDSNSDTGDIEESRQMPKDNEALTSKMSPKSTLDNSNKRKENEDVCDVKEMSGSCNRSEEIVKSRKSSLCSNKSEGSSKTEGMNNDSQHSDNEESRKKSKKHSKRKLSLSRRKSNSDNDSDNDSMLRKHKSSKVLTKKIQVIDDDSSDDKSQEDCVKNKCNESEDLEKLNKCETNKEESNDSQDLSNLKSTNLDEKQDDVEKVADTSQVENNDVKQSESVPVKPMIKCVNINKLLKPDIAENVGESPKKESKSRTEKISESTKKRKVISTSDEKFWEQKRKEVSAFIPKKFVINVIRLPRLSQRFLHLHGLRRIVQNDKTISELQTENGNKAVEAENLKCDSSKKSSAETLNVVKNALLNDSDSDKSEGSKSPLPLAEIEKTVQNVLHDVNPAMDSTLQSFEELNRTIEKVLKDSAESDHKTKDDDVGKESSHESTTNNTEKLKNALLNDSDSDNSKGTEKSTENEKSCKEKSPLKETDLKQTLLAGSDSENTEHNRTNSNMQDNNSSKSNKVDEIATESSQCNNPAPDAGLEISPIKKKKHKRKSMMESMHAKKMLLNYSSSSDTEDEQLKNAFKQIKDALLKGASSSDDEKKKKDAQGSSEDDMISRKSKRKHSRCSNDEDSDKGSRGLKVNPNTSDQTSEQSRKKGHSKRSKKKMGRSRAQPGGSSQNSDSQDPNDKDIDGLTNLKSLTNRRRRDSNTTASTDTNSVKKSSRMGKPPLISEENMLKAEDSSEAGSAAESDDAGEELPSISISGLNGSGIEHLAKDDLLDESDTSVSHKEESDDIKKTDDSDEEAVKSKRRKAQLISSDSEAGSSRRNIEKAERVSDFEDSEEDSSEPGKRSKRKKKGDESDASAGSSSSNDGSKKKRRRIKQIDSDVSGSDTENEGRNKHGRKNIRKVMGKNQLEEATKKAAREEKERIARIAERQKVYNNLEFDESGKPDEVVLEKVVLDFDPETKEPLIQVDRGLVKKLKPHQANGIKFMWDACFESVKRIKKDKGSGCILAHCMGLGKTLQVVSLTHTLLTHSSLTSVQRVLVVCPLSTVLNWVNEFKMWLKHAETDLEVDVYELSRHKQNSERAFQLQQWFSHGGVCVLGYEMFRNLSADNNKKFKKKMLKNFQESLVDPGPDLVVCDEGHLLKNEKTSLSQSMNRVKTRRRIVLTGTPLQNNLKEYYCMVQFVKPNLLGKYNEYLNRFVNPITNGQYTDSTEHDIRIMKRRSHVLHKMLDGAVQRRDYGVLAPFLPPKHEYVLFITLTDVQVKLYQYYLDNYSRRPLPGKSSGFLFPDFQSLQRIWTHPLVLKYNSERYEIMQQKKREREEEDSEGSLVDFIDDDSTPDESSTEESSDDLSDMSDDSRKKSKKKKSAKKSKAKESKVSTRRGTRANPVEMEEEEASQVLELKSENPTEWWVRLVEEDELEDMRNSHKLVLLFDILRQCETIGDKLLVFSQSLYSLDLIEHFLGKVDEATQDGRIDEKLGNHVGSWSPGVDYFRLDGSTSCENRSIWCKNFNREDNPRARLFLISTRAGGLGINLVAANRVVIFDVSWNPSHDVQSIFRVYRFGQKKPCYIYRFLAMGTMEEKIYERQVTKQAISKRVIDEQQIDRHYAENDLAELYKFEASPPTPRPIPPLPRDRLFAEMLREHDKQIYKYHEHDSLLENKEEETLSEEERKAAWEDFENEKNRPPPAPFVSAWPMHNGMVPGLLAQQQQQLAYAALAAMLRKDMPNINDNQIRDMLPLIYNANPAMFGGYDYGLMQKMGEMYKYSQPGMMNPGMMNPMGSGVTASSGGGGGGMGGASGLQYEPPWQRQHQQQQQMRLQQLMQQNAMGAKYYAGGLGSRDPVAMALQQQRAREIMSGERAPPRPRGRPPLAPRAPPAHHPDVVNLDSD